MRKWAFRGSVRCRNSVFRFYKKSSTLPRVVWAEESKTGLAVILSKVGKGSASLDDDDATSVSMVWSQRCHELEQAAMLSFPCFYLDVNSFSSWEGEVSLDDHNATALPAVCFQRYFGQKRASTLLLLSFCFGDKSFWSWEGERAPRRS